jgi:hypothetical protein
MRQLFAILVLLGLAIGFTAVSASADGFTVTFSVGSGVLGTSPIGDMSPDIPVTFNLTTPGLSLTGESGIVNFFTAADGGLFGLMFTGLNGNIFMVELFGEGCPTGATCVGGFTDGTPPLLTTGGPFAIDPTSFFGEFSPGGTALGGGTISSGTVTTTTVGTSVGYVVDGTLTGIPSFPFPTVPEPSTLVLLGSGILALAGLTRKHSIARFFN